MASGELNREGAQRRKALKDFAKALRTIVSSFTQIMTLIKRIVARKQGLPNLDDLARILTLVNAAIKAVTSLTSWANTLDNVFKIIG